MGDISNRSEMVEHAEDARQAFSEGLARLVRIGRDRSPELVNLVGGLFHFMNDRATTVLGLVVGNRLWDAEILMRPSMEALLRILHVCYATDDDRSARIAQYWCDLSDLNALRQSIRARRALSIRGQEDPEADVFKALILDEELEQRIRDKYPTAERNRLTRSWSALEIIASLTKLKGRWKTDPLASFVHSYGMSSHLIHADESGLGLIRDRLDRPSDERTALEDAHACRMLSDIVYSAALVGLGLVDALALDGALLRAGKEKARLFDSKAAPLIRKFYELQRPFYSDLKRSE